MFFIERLKGSFFIRFAVVKNDFTRDRERRERER